jgi:hypothetical protein
VVTLVGTGETSMLMALSAGKSMSRCQMETRILLGPGPEATLLHHGKASAAFCPCPDSLWKAEFKDDGLTYLSGH